MFEDILGLNKDDIQNLTEIATSDRAKDEGVGARQHNYEFRTATGITVVKTSEGFTHYIPCKKDETTTVPDDSRIHCYCRELQERRFNPKEEQTLKKLGENIARLTGLNALIAHIVFYDDRGISRNALKPHQDRYAHFLGFGVLKRENDCTLTETEPDKHSKQTIVYQKLGLINKHMISYGLVQNENIDKIKNLEKITDQTGAGYFVNQKFEKDGKIIVHERTIKRCNAKRVVCILRIIAAKEAEETVLGESLKKVYLSDPKITNALSKITPKVMTKNEKRHIDTDNAAPYIKRVKH